MAQRTEKPCFAGIGDDAAVPSIWSALGSRVQFWGRAMSVGARWTWDVLDKTARVLAVAAIIAVSVGGVLLHQPAKVIGLAVGLLVIFSFAEGTYRVAREAERQGVAADSDADAIWLSERLAEGNALLDRWTPRLRLDKEGNIVHEVSAWEQITRNGLAERLPSYSGHFGVDVGLGREFITFPGEYVERARLRRRIHRLAEIVERYGRERTK
jgi:hypothetical protein